MIDNLLDQSAIEAGQQHLAVTQVSLRTVIMEVVEELGPLVREKNHRVAFPKDEDIWVSADQDKLQQIVMNILANAVKYTAHGGSITVDAFATGGMATVTISDTGEGIPPDQIPRLFDPFFRVQRAGRNKVQGLGLGLSIVKQLVQLHGGSIEVHSELGKGTRIAFSVPLATPPPIRTTRSTEAAILIVDDDPDIRETLSDRLRAWDFRVVTVCKGEECLAVLNTEDVRGVLLDIGMPGMDGIQTLASIRDRYPGIPIIIITAAASEARAADAISSGAQGYLLKPISANRLQQTVERWFTPVTLQHTKV
jgi:CheY-like chemotaxis protein/two-component sensor histidine kinase